MSFNETTVQWDAILGSYITVGVSSVFIFISTIICLIIITLIYLTPNLHSPTNLLITNTCLCTVFYSTISIINTVFYFNEFATNDFSCRIRGYLNYVSLILVIYSYVIQAISRVFWTVLYRYRYLLTIKSHKYLIISQICLSFLFPLSALITDNIVFRPFKLCLVPTKYKIHSFYILSIGYIIPFLTVIILYGIIYRSVIHSTANVRRSNHGTKRDAELARNILILLSIFVFGGIPVAIYIIISSSSESVPTILFWLANISPSVSVAVEKIVTIMLNKDIRKALKQRWRRYILIYRTPLTRVQPFPGNTKRDQKPIRIVGGMLYTANTQKKQEAEPNVMHIRESMV